jgi:hypothetical protein
VAVTVADPAACGVNTPAEVTVPFVADQLTAELKLPLPLTVVVQVLDAVVRIVLGEQVTATEATVLVGCDVVGVLALPPPQPARKHKAASEMAHGQTANAFMNISASARCGSNSKAPSDGDAY